MSKCQNISNEVLLEINREARLTSSYLALMSIAGVLAAISMLVNSIPILIGAMVVAPVLPPVQRIAIGLVGGEPASAARGVGVMILGLALALLLAFVTTRALNELGILAEEANLAHKPLLEERLRPGWYSVPVAVAAGIAGAIATVQKKTAALIGVVAAVALVPAAAAAGIALTSPFPERAIGGLVLLAANVSAIVGSSILVLTLWGHRLSPPAESNLQDAGHE